MNEYNRVEAPPMTTATDLAHPRRDVRARARCVPRDARVDASEPVDANGEATHDGRRARWTYR